MNLILEKNKNKYKNLIVILRAFSTFTRFLPCTPSCWFIASLGPAVHAYEELALGNVYFKMIAFQGIWTLFTNR